MKKLQMFCLTLKPYHYSFIKDLDYLPVGLGDEKFDENWFRDNSGKNISNKNKNYGEYTFHYWVWKNYIDKIDYEWIGFCQYRKFWSLEKANPSDISFDKLSSQTLKGIPKDYERYDSILGSPIFINQFKIMKFIKKGFKIIVKNPVTIFDKKKRNLNFHFDLMHGQDNLNKAIDLLDSKNKEDFRKFVNTEVSFNPHNMFICKTKDILNNYYNDIFPWLEKCENIFGFKNLKGYDKTRIYGFLAERFMSYWFQKNTKYTTIPIIFYDIRKDLN